MSMNTETLTIGSLDNALRAIVCENARLDIRDGMRYQSGNDDIQFRTHIPEHEYNTDEWDSYASIQFEDWIHLGAGCSRSAWLCPDDGVVYKVGHYDVNNSEFENFERFSSLSDPRLNVRIPRMTHFAEIGFGRKGINRYDYPIDYSVLGVERIIGEPYFDVYHDEDVRMFCQSMGNWDIHPWNVLLTSEGDKVVIDFA